jgi:hypothetical protein
MSLGIIKVLLPVLAVMLSAALPHAQPAQQLEVISEPAAVVRDYLRAVYARDFSEAYRYLSSADQRVKTLAQYLRQRGPYSGFALEIARTLAALIEVEVISKQVAGRRMLLKLRYRVPDPDKIAPLLLHWNAYRLNSLSPDQRRELTGAIENNARDNAIEMVGGEEELTLVKEDEQWRIFLDWVSGITIPVRTILAKLDGSVDVRLSHTEIKTQPGEIFEITLKMTNRSQTPLTVSIGHLIRPKELAAYLDIVQCGFLLPVKLPPAVEQEYSGTYLLRGSLPEGVQRLGLEYDFRPLR